jgi:hypothetical protein
VIIIWCYVVISVSVRVLDHFTIEEDACDEQRTARDIPYTLFLGIPLLSALALQVNSLMILHYLLFTLK